MFKTLKHFVRKFFFQKNKSDDIRALLGRAVSAVHLDSAYLFIKKNKKFIFLFKTHTFNEIAYLRSLHFYDNNCLFYFLLFIKTLY